MAEQNVLVSSMVTLRRWWWQQRWWWWYHFEHANFYCSKQSLLPWQTTSKSGKRRQLLHRKRKSVSSGLFLSEGKWRETGCVLSRFVCRRNLKKGPIFVMRISSNTFNCIIVPNCLERHIYVGDPGATQPQSHQNLCCMGINKKMKKNCNANLFRYYHCTNNYQQLRNSIIIILIMFIMNYIFYIFSNEGFASAALICLEYLVSF